MFVRKVSVFLAAALVSLPMTANADETWTPGPEIDWGIEAPTMIVQAPKHAWGTRRILRYLDEQLPGLTVYFGKCYTMPDVPCMKVYTREYGTTGWLGMFSFMDNASTTVRRIQYNETYIKTTGKLYAQARANVSCHEVLHALGMPHHEGDGCLPDRQPYPSASEMSVLQAYYQ